MHRVCIDFRFDFDFGPGVRALPDFYRNQSDCGRDPSDFGDALVTPEIWWWHNFARRPN